MSKKQQHIKTKSENDLIDLAKKNSKYFGPLYKKYHEQIFRFIYQRMDSEADTSDVTSQTFLKALLALPKYQNRGFPFSSWLYRIALNEINQHYRKSKKGRAVNVDESNIKDIIEESGEEHNEIKRDGLLKALSELDEGKLILIEMRFFEKRSFKEMGQILNITENNAKVRTYRVIGEMKNKML